MEKQKIQLRTFFHPGWLLLALSIPQTILFVMFFHSFMTFRPDLTDGQILLWRNFALGYGTLVVAYVIYGLQRWVKNQPIHGLVSPLIFLTFTPLLYMYFTCLEDLLEFGISESTDSIINFVLLYPGTFLMPGFMYALFLSVLVMTPEKCKNRSLLNFIGMVAIPLGWYLFFTLIMPLFRTMGDVPISEHLITVLAIGSTVAFFFLLFRFFFVMLRKLNHRSVRLNMVWRFVFGLVLPLTGLLVYEHLMPELDWSLHREVQNLIGCFSHPLFLVLAILNGIALTVPQPTHKGFHWAVFAVRSLCLPYTIYFCLVFLPFVPFSLIAVLFFGLGLLMLAPFFLLIVQARALIADYKTLNKQTSRLAVALVMLVSALILPGSISLNYYLDRITLHNALGYVFENKPLTPVNRDRLQTILGSLHYSDVKIPYITRFRNWLVLDDRRLAGAKLARLQKVFFDKGKRAAPQTRFVKGDQSVVISSIEQQTVWEQQTSTYRSRINLELTNRDQSMAEYATSFFLPAGVWVSDYFLKIGDQEVPGRLMEKKSALWIYNRIVARKKDPGLVYYLNENRLALRVFPLGGGETRKTGFELIYKEPFRFSIDNHVLNLGLRTTKNRTIDKAAFPVLSPDGRVVYVSKNAKNQLPQFTRKPYYHFILDLSASCEQAKPKYAETIDQWIVDRRLDTSFAKVTLANYAFKTYFWQDSWQKKLASYPCEGGFFLDKAIKSILVNHHKAMSQVYPVIIVVSDNFKNAVLPDFLDLYAFALPEIDYYYQLESKGNTIAHPLVSHPVDEAFGDSQAKVRVWPTISNPKAFFKDNGNPSVALIPERLVQSRSGHSTDRWLQGLALWGKTKQLLFDSKTDAHWTELVYLSKQHRLLNRFTAFTVLENQSQWNLLEKKEKTALKAQKTMKTETNNNRNVNRMSEPSVIGVGVFAFLLLGIARRRQAKQLVTSRIE